MKTTAAPEDSTVHTNLLDQPTTVAIPPIQTGKLMMMIMVEMILMVL